MAEEPDQTKWVGIRPATGCNNIPVASQKQAPAIGDLQAIKEIYYHTQQFWAKNCAVSYSGNLQVVAADEIWVINNIAMVNNTSMCDMLLRTNIAAAGREFESFYNIPAGQWATWKGQLILTTGDRIQGQWQLGGAADDLVVNTHGYRIGVY